jgi:hypothetical protein
MANTTKLSLEDRKKAKRQVRREIKGKFESLNRNERKTFRKTRRTDKVPFLTWLRQHEAAKKAAE